jgi:hypothetical protein
MIYRVIKRLSVGTKLSGYVEPGGMVTDDDLGLRVATILVKRGAISPVKAPPLDVLPGWHLRAQKFEAAGYDAITLLECDTELIARETGYQERSIEKWKRELMEYLEVKPSQVRRGCCNDEEPEAESEPEEIIEEETEQEQMEVLDHATDE